MWLLQLETLANLLFVCKMGYNHIRRYDKKWKIKECPESYIILNFLDKSISKYNCYNYLFHSILKSLLTVKSLVSVYDLMTQKSAHFSLLKPKMLHPGFIPSHSIRKY